MAAKGFIELLRLTDLGNSSQNRADEQSNRWSGVAFEMGGMQFVAPLGDISEVVYVPEWANVPNTPDWICGIANIRGRLLVISHLQSFLFDVKTDITPDSKVLCLSHPEHYCGVVVDKVFGIQHFNVHSYFKQSENLSSELGQFCQGYFMYQNKPWHVFMFRDMLDNQKFKTPSH